MTITRGRVNKDKTAPGTLGNLITLLQPLIAGFYQFAPAVRIIHRMCSTGYDVDCYGGGHDPDPTWHLIPPDYIHSAEDDYR
jgi:cyclophilin family peptidyl-prolyl cis-trans isomerase